MLSQYNTTCGTGLGLYLTKLQTEVLGGSIEVRSPWTAEHPGAEFRVVLPSCTTSAAPRILQSPSPPEQNTLAAPVFQAGARVLVADDIRVNRALLRRAFTTRFGLNWSVHEAVSAEEALSLLRPGHGFDLVVMDEIFSDARSNLSTRQPSLCCSHAVF